MTRVLIAVDDSEDSVQAARAATELFGQGAEYLVVNVAQTIGPESMVPWGLAMPYQPELAIGMYAVPAAAVAPTGVAIADENDDPAMARAEEQASEVAREADVHQAEVVGAVGDPATAIVEAAHEHLVDVIVVGSHDKSWFQRLFAGSVRADVVRRSDIPVLVVK